MGEVITTLITLNLPQRFDRLAENELWGEPMNIKSVAARNKRTSDSAQSTKSGGKILLAIAFGLMSLQLAGCCNIPKPDIFDGTLMDKAFGCYRDNVWAKRACNLRYSNCNRPYSNHFEAGFEAGYIDICNGGDGYVPATPPECYWGFDYQTPDGAQCVNAWFEGYPSGVAAAKRDRAGTYRDVYVSRMIQSAISLDKATKTTPQDVPVVKPEDKVPTVTPDGQPRQATLPVQPTNQPTAYVPPVVPGNGPTAAAYVPPVAPGNGGPTAAAYIPPVVPGNYYYGARR